MKLNKSFGNSLTESIYVALLVINNLVAFYFITIVAIFHEFPYHKYSELEMYLLIALGGFMISFFFSLISLVVTVVFKKYFIAALTGQLKFFLIQLSFLFSIFIIAFFSPFFFHF